MRRKLMFLPALGLAASLGFALPAQAASAPNVARPVSLQANLTGEAEVPGPGDPNGSGTARVVAIPSQNRVCFVIQVQGIQPANAAHIHEGAADEAGPVVVTLPAPTNGVSAGCVTTSEASDIAEDPANYYVNIHNADFPAGAVRGQLG